MRRLVRVAIVDSHAALRAALRTLIAGEDGMQVVGEAGDRRAAADAGDVDVVVVDERVAGAGTRQQRAALVAMSRRAPVVVTGMGDPALYAGAHLEAGAAGYWPKFGEVDALIALVRRVAAVEPTAAPTRVVAPSA
jgi:DNA-binding NarL/FixJ family response regulator